MPRFKRGIQYPRDGSAQLMSRGLLDRPVKPGDDINWLFDIVI
jgi:hypothetical protein